MVTRGQSASFAEGKDNFAVLTYQRRGRDYKVYIPYQRKLIPPMGSTTVYLTTAGDKINITQQPGVPYLLTANEMGGSQFLLVDENSEHLYVDGDKHISF